MKPIITRERLALVEAAVPLVQPVVGTDRAPERVVVHRRELRAGFADARNRSRHRAQNPVPRGSRFISPMLVMISSRFTTSIPRSTPALHRSIR